MEEVHFVRKKAETGFGSVLISKFIVRGLL